MSGMKLETAIDQKPDGFEMKLTISRIAGPNLANEIGEAVTKAIVDLMATKGAHITKDTRVRPPELIIPGMRQ